MTRHQKRRQLATWIANLLGWKASNRSRLARSINAEPLEKRELMASDGFTALLGSSQHLDSSSLMSEQFVSSSPSDPIWTGSRLVGEGEAADDLVAFAKALAATTTKFYGADWCNFCTQQKNLFEDGYQYLPFVEVTNPDRTPNSVATANNITTYPTWVFPDGSRLTGVQSLATIAQRSGVAIPKSNSVYFAELNDLNIGTRSPLMVPLDGYSPNGRPISYTVSSSNPNVVAASLEASSNRSMRITTEGYGDMVFELFEDKAPRPTGRVIQLAQEGFYNGLTFHRVASDALGNPFVIQGGDPQGTGSGGSSLGNFDDQYHVDLLHNGSGVLSFAKSTDDTNNSQFFVTASSTRFLDFNHSVFGKLVEGESVRRGIQRVAVNANDRPQFTVTMSNVSIFQDTENAVILLKPGTTSGTSTITVTASDDQGNQFSRTFVVTVGADTNNGAPFLNDIPTLNATSGQALNYTLTSQDREGDTVTYSVSRVGTVNYALTVNPQTGVVTITPPTGFTGSLQFRATVQQTASSTTIDKTDSQIVNVNVAGEAAPLTLDLVSTSDTGISNTDNLTNANNLVFSVGGTTAGGTVEILNGTNVVGVATASGASTQVTVNATSLTGAQQFTARHTLNSQITTSSALTVTLDRTAPAQISVNGLPSSVAVGSSLNANLSHAEEGSGLRYAFENAPAGLTIDASTGVITWTPIASQVGTRSFVLELTDAAGNVTSQNLSINVIQDPKLRLRLNFVSADGTPITSVQVGQQFRAQVLVSDLRSGSAALGAFSVYTDLTYDSSVIAPIANNPIRHISPYTGSKSGEVGNGLIDELGALAGVDPTGSDERVLAEVTFTALATGTANLRFDPSDEVANETTLYGDSGALSPSQIQYGNSSLTVGADFQVVNDTFNFDEDAAQQTLNVLNNDTASSGTNLTIVEVSTPSRGGTLTIASDGKSLRYTPATNVNGAEIFTYTVANAANVRQTGTVTVQLTDINDPPVATADTFSVAQDSTQNVLDVLANDTRGVDPSTETLTVTQVGTGSQGGTISVGTSGLNIRYTPRAGFSGTETFTYTLSDNRGGTAIGTVSVTVSPPVPSPTAVGDSFSVTEDAAEASFDVIANDTPAVAGDTLSLESVGTSSRGSTVSIGSDGKMKYKPAANFAGTETITYVVRESNGGRATGTVTFTVSNVNDAPVANADTLSALSTDTTTNLNVLTNDTDPDTGDTITITSITQPTTGSGTLAISSDNRSVIYTPPSGTFEGTFTFSYTIRDSAGLTSTATASVKVESFTPRAIKGKVMFNQTQRLANIPLTLTGTSSNGTAISQTVTSGVDGSFTFNSLAPGNYSLKRDPLPFLNDSGQQVSITSAKTDTDFATDLTVTGSLQSQYIDIRDFLGSSFLRTLTAAVRSNGTAQWTAPQGDWADFTSLTFQVNTNNLTINASRPSASNLTANVPFTNPLLSTATSGDFQLLRLRGPSTAFNLAVPSNVSNSGSSSSSGLASGEGESSALQASMTGSSISALTAEGEAGGNATASPELNLNNSPSSSARSSSSRSILQALLGSNSQTAGSTAASSSNSTSGSTSAQLVDEAMKDVASGLKTSISNPLLSMLASSKTKRN